MYIPIINYLIIFYDHILIQYFSFELLLPPRHCKKSIVYINFNMLIYLYDYTSTYYILLI